MSDHEDYDGDLADEDLLMAMDGGGAAVEHTQNTLGNADLRQQAGTLNTSYPLGRTTKATGDRQRVSPVTTRRA